ncbi:MAG: VOC family protein [Arenicellales bacterium]
MTVLGLHHYNIHAPRDLLPGVRDFYVDILGLVEGSRPPFRSFGYWLYAGDRPIVHLSADEASPTAADNRSAIDHVAFACADFDATCRRLKSKAIDFTVAEVPGEGFRQVFFTDPLGNGIELSFAPHQGQRNAPRRMRDTGANGGSIST